MSVNLILPTVVMDNVDLSTDQTSAPIYTMYSDNIGVQFVWTGTPTGTFGIDISNTATLAPDGSITGGAYIPLVLTSPQPPTPNGSAGSGFININQTPAAFIKVTYKRTSGFGSCTATLSAKPV